MTGRSPLARVAAAKASEGSDGPPRDANALLACGDRKGAIAALMDAHGDAVFGFCLRILGERALAEDVLQQVFLEAYRDIDRFEGRSPLSAWLTGIAHHRCQDAINARRRRLRSIELDPQAANDVAAPDATPTERLERTRLVAALEECLNALPYEVRRTVLLRFHSGLSYAEMSALLGVKADTLHARVARALPALKRCLERKGWSDE